MQYLIFSAFILLSQLSYCSTISPQPSVQEAGQLNNDEQKSDRRRKAVNAAWRSKEWYLVVAGKTEQDRAALLGIAEEIISHHPDEKQFTLVELAELSEAERYRLPILLLANYLPAEIWTNLGGNAENDYRGYDLSQAEWLLQAYYLENPWTPQDTSMAMNLVFANEAEQLAAALRKNYAASDYRRLFRGQYGYLLDEGNESRLRGFFNDNSWRPDPSRELRFEAVGSPVYVDSTIQIFAPDGAPSLNELKDVSKQLSRRARQLAQILGIEDTLPHIQLQVYPNLERITLRHKNMEEIQYSEEKHTLYLSMDDYRRTLGGSATNYCLLQWLKQVAGQSAIFPNEPYLERGLAALLTFPSPVHYSTQALAESGLLLDKSALSEVNRGDYGAYLYDYTAAIYCRDYVLSRKQKMPLGSPTATGEADLATSLVNKLPLSVLGTMKSSAAPVPEKRFQRGMTFAHEGYQVINGYGGSTVPTSLDSLAELFVNSLAVVPYTFQRDPKEVANLPVSESPGGENNGATRNSIRQAHKRNWTVMLKPQIWVGRNSWPGDIDMQSEKDWATWFENYSTWILNYALMAEEEGVASLCIGTELRYTTLKQPDRWRELIRLIRSVYRGKLTYAANWGEEFEQLSFWEELDVIGLNSYYPLNDRPSATDEELLAGARKWVRMAEKVATKYDRPWWLTEVGFRSVENAWLNPHAGADDRPADYAAQLRCYRALTTALNEEGNHLEGMYVWKWPSYLDGFDRRGSDDSTSFHPVRKPATQVLAEFYRSRK